MAKRWHNSQVWQCEERFYLSLNELTDSLEISRETILEMIAEEVIQAEKDDQAEWLFDAQAIRSVQTVSRLTHDLGVNLPGAYLIIDLLKEIERLRFLTKA